MSYIPNMMIKSTPEMLKASCFGINKQRWCSTLDQDPLISHFKNKTTFSSKSTFEIIRALAVFRVCSIEPLVDNQEKIMDMCRKVVGDTVFDSVMRHSFFNHFVAGEDFESVKIYLKKLESQGVGGIIDYAVESDLSMESTDSFNIQIPYNPEELKKKTLHERYLFVSKLIKELKPAVDNDSFSWKLNSFLESIKITASSKLGSFVAIKITSLINPSTLLKINSYLEKMREIFEKHAQSSGQMKLEEFTKAISELELSKSPEEVLSLFKLADTCKQGFVSWYDWISMFHLSIYMRDIFDKCPEFFLTQQQWWEATLMMIRVKQIVNLSKELNVRIMVDAEQSYFQSAIHLITIGMQKDGNQKLPIVYNTYQCYLKKTDKAIEDDLRYAKKCSTPFLIAAKCVRGAYVSRETAYSTETGREYPIHPNYEATSECYNRSVSRMLDGVAERKTALCVASHNMHSVILAVRKLESLKIDPHNCDVCFGQLLGMYDHLTFGLANLGYNAYKYLPFGPVKDVMPYLARRAVENKSIMKKTSDEIEILKSELCSRVSNPFNRL